MVVSGKLINGRSSTGTGATFTQGTGISIQGSVVSIDDDVVAKDTDVLTKLNTKVSQSDNNLSFTGTAPKFSNNLTVADRVLAGNNSGFGIVCKPEHNNLTDYSLLFDTEYTMLNKRNTGTGECAIRLGNNNKIAVVDTGAHADCLVYITPTSVNGTGLTVSPTHVICNETLQMQGGKNIVVPVESKLTIGGTDIKTDLDANTTKLVSHTADIATNTTNIATNTTNIATNTAKLSALTPFQQTWTYSRNVLITARTNEREIWTDSSSVWVDSATGITGILPDGIYTCKITTLASDVHGNGASDNNLLWVFTGCFTHFVNNADATFDNGVPEIIETVSQWWHKNDLTSNAGSRAVIVRNTTAGFKMNTHFRFTNVPQANESNIKLQFTMKRLF